jgi:hypothetical protein
MSSHTPRDAPAFLRGAQFCSGFDNRRNAALFSAPPHGPVGVPPRLGDMRFGDMTLGATATILLLIAILVLYMLPTLIAFGREHPHREELAVINIVVGWTLIGWIAVFLWATLVHTEDELT